MMYQVFYYVHSLIELTGHEHKSLISEDQVFELIRDGKVNVMILNGDDHKKHSLRKEIPNGK